MHSLKNPQADAIRQMFDHLAPRYDLFNHLTSLGLASYWRREALRVIQPGMRVLDLGCGTGDLALVCARIVGPKGEVVGLDFSPKMLDLARRRSQKEAPGLNGRLRFVLGEAQDLPFEERPYDTVVSGFVLRNLAGDIERVLQGVYRSLRPGGIISFLDITQPPPGFFRILWEFYMNAVVLLYGRLLFGKHYPRFYLTESAGRFLKPAEFLKKLGERGFEAARCRKFLFGTIALYQARKSLNS